MTKYRAAGTSLTYEQSKIRQTKQLLASSLGFDGKELGNSYP